MIYQAELLVDVPREERIKRAFLLVSCGRGGSKVFTEIVKRLGITRRELHDEWRVLWRAARARREAK
jgi:hypothetical protein